MPRLLLVEDAPDVALIVERLGRRLGLDVACRADVASAWECARAAVPDLVLLDLNLAGERGEELCRRLRASPETARVPVALFVHLACGDDVVSGLEAGADYLVAKDLLGRPDEWLARLREILPAGDGLGGRVSVSCQRNAVLPPPSPETVRALNGALRHPLLRQLGPGVLRLVLRRADGGRRWLEPDGLALDVGRVAASASAGEVRAFADAVTEQAHRLLGHAAEPLREAIAAAVPGG
ncbi:MAG TPA: response regulator [Gemmataceae bacterium]|nr:response regulator [Gemmataceae bacterium]